MGAVRLADLLAGLSRVADLGFGLPVGTALRSCLLATRLAREAGLPEPEVRDAFYTALLHHVGCVGYAYETAELFGDDLAVNRAAGRTDTASSRDVLTTFLPLLTEGRPPRDRARLVLAALTRGDRWGDAFTRTACEVGRESARRLGLPSSVQASLGHVYDTWGRPDRPGALTGEDIPYGARVARLSGVAALFAVLGGTAAAVEAVRRRAGGMLDPALVTCFAVHADTWLADLDRADVRDVVLADEPDPAVTVFDLAPVAEVFGDLSDLTSPWFAGHARAVSSLAAGAAARLSLPAPTHADLVVAGLLADVGRVAVSNAVWDRPGPLDDAAWEAARLHPYHSERVLAGSTALGRLAPLVGRHHERLDGSGYHHGSTAEDLSVPARALAAADAYRTLTEPRPHRPARTPEQAEARLRDEVRGGTLDPDAVEAVLAAAGHPSRPSAQGRPGALSAREVEVLGLVAGGCTNAQIAARLVISRRTAEHHVQHIYTKIGASGRAAATLYALENHLLLPSTGGDG